VRLELCCRFEYIDGSLPVQMLTSLIVDSVISCTLCPLTVDFLLHLVVLQGGLYIQVFYFQGLLFLSHIVSKALCEALIVYLRSWFFILPLLLYFNFVILQVLSKLLLRTHLLPFIPLSVNVLSCLHKFASMLILLSFSCFYVLVICDHFLLAF